MHVLPTRYSTDRNLDRSFLRICKIRNGEIEMVNFSTTNPKWVLESLQACSCYCTAAVVISIFDSIARCHNNPSLKWTLSSFSEKGVRVPGLETQFFLSQNFLLWHLSLADNQSTGEIAHRRLQAMISNLLTGRLRTIANFVPQYCVLADIGCDHGLLSVGLSEHCSKVWAIDISPLAIQGNSHWQHSKVLHYSHHYSNTEIYIA